MSRLIKTVEDEKTVIESIDPARDVDDDVSIGDSTIVRLFNIRTNGSKRELSIFDVFAVAPEFLPGRVYGSLKISNVNLQETESNAHYVLRVQYVRYELETPYAKTIDWEWESSVIELPAYRDVDGKPLVTTAGEPIQGLTRRLKLWVLKGTRNVPGVPRWFRDYGVSINSDITRIDGEKFKPKELQLQRLSLGKWEEETINDQEFQYRQLSFEFWFNPLSWTTEVFNLGFSEIEVRRVKNAAGKLVNQVHQVRATNDGEETKGKVFLDENGRRPRDKEGRIKTILDPEDIVVLKFDLDEKLPYNPLLK